MLFFLSCSLCSKNMTFQSDFRQDLQLAELHLILYLTENHQVFGRLIKMGKSWGFIFFLGWVVIMNRAKDKLIFLLVSRCYLHMGKYFLYDLLQLSVTFHHSWKKYLPMCSVYWLGSKFHWNLLESWRLLKYSWGAR